MSSSIEPKERAIASRRLAMGERDLRCLALGPVERSSIAEEFMSRSLPLSRFRRGWRSMTTKDGYYVWEPASVSIIDQFIVLNTLSMNCDTISRTSRTVHQKTHQLFASWRSSSRAGENTNRAAQLARNLFGPAPAEPSNHSHGAIMRLTVRFG